MVVGLARGGVPVAAEVADALQLPIGVLVVRKLGWPGQQELAMGAMTSAGMRLLEPGSVPDAVLQEAAFREGQTLARREERYRAFAPPPEVRGLRVLLVDDGLATGASMLAAIAWARKQGATEVVVAVPVAPASTCEEVAREADELVVLLQPSDFVAVGQFYEDFEQVTDEAVESCLRSAVAARCGPALLHPERWGSAVDGWDGGSS
jgi:predicted phosphoribosyltransferase